MSSGTPLADGSRPTGSGSWPAHCTNSPASTSPCDAFAARMRQQGDEPLTPDCADARLKSALDETVPKAEPA